MKTVHKFAFDVTDSLMIDMPTGAKLLHVDVQNGPCLWALVDPASDQISKRRFEIYGTGHALHDAGGLEYVGTFQLYGGAFVGHLFERRR